MELPQIPQDDLLDVIEMTQKLESYITRTLQNNEITLSMSALMSATINCMLEQCETLDDVLLYRNTFIQILDCTIKNIKLKGKD